MTEAIRAVIAFGFERMNLNRIEADADARNPASGRVLEKVGFRREGIQREQFFENDTFNDLMLFALLRRDYRDKIVGGTILQRHNRRHWQPVRIADRQPAVG